MGASETEKAYLPFQRLEPSGGRRHVTAWLAADEQAFYFAAKVPQMDDMIRYETRDDDGFFYPEKVKSQGKEFSVARRGAPVLLPEGLRYPVRQRQA